MSSRENVIEPQNEIEGETNYAKCDKWWVRDREDCEKREQGEKLQWTATQVERRKESINYKEIILSYDLWFTF